MNHKTDTFAQRDLTQSDTKGTDADAGVMQYYKQYYVM